MYFKGHYQNAYVTHDIDRAMELFAERFGLSDYINYDADMPMMTPAGEQSYHCRLALAWSGHLQIELIQPISGSCIDHYLRYLPADKADFTPRFHHVAVRRNDPEAMRQEIAGMELPIAFEGGIPGLIFAYLDAREWMGHYLEMQWATDEVWAYNGWPADKPID